jgi:hypothetical protein
LASYDTSSTFLQGRQVDCGGRYCSPLEDAGFDEDRSCGISEDRSLSSSHSVSRSRSTSQFASGRRGQSSDDEETKRQCSSFSVRQQWVRTQQEGKVQDDDSDDCTMILIDDGEDGDMDEENEEEEEEPERKVSSPLIFTPLIYTPHKEAHAKHNASFDDQRFEATTRSSQAHDARVCSIIENCFAGAHIICFERLYRTTLSVQSITKESVLRCDHMLLPEPVATQVSYPTHKHTDTHA